MFPHNWSLKWDDPELGKDVFGSYLLPDRTVSPLTPSRCWQPWWQWSSSVLAAACRWRRWSPPPPHWSCPRWKPPAHCTQSKMIGSINIVFVWWSVCSNYLPPLRPLWRCRITFPIYGSKLISVPSIRVTTHLNTKRNNNSFDPLYWIFSVKWNVFKIYCVNSSVFASQQ